MAKVKFTKAELKQLGNRILGRLDAFRVKASQVGSLTHRVDQLERKNKGIELANERAAKLENRADQIEIDVRALLARLDEAVPVPATATNTDEIEIDDKLLKELTGEIDKLNGKVDQLWQDQQEEINGLRKDVGELQRVQGEHGEQLANIGPRLSGAELGLSAVIDHVAELEGSDVVVKESTPWSVPLVGLLAGAAGAAFWWWLGYTGHLQQTLTQLNLVFTYEVAKGPIGIIIAGLAVFLAVTGLMSVFVPKTITRSIRRREDDYHHTSTIPQPPHPAAAGDTTPWAAGSPEAPQRKEVVAS